MLVGEIDVVTNIGPIDLVAGEFDAGIQLGEYIQKDMIAVRITERLRLAVSDRLAMSRHEASPVPEVAPCPSTSALRAYARGERGTVVIPAEAGPLDSGERPWIPAFAGMTREGISFVDDE